MSNNPQQPSGGEPGGRRRGRDIPAEIERELRGKRGSRGPQRGSHQEDDLHGSQRDSSQEQPGQRGARQVPEPAHGSHPVGRETRAEPHRSHWGRYAALGIVGLLLLGGLIGGLVAAFSGSSAKTTPAALAHPATHPSASATSHLLQQFQNTGPNNSANFPVTSSPLTSHYTYSCPSGANTFSAQLFNTSGAGQETIASTRGTGGSGSVVLHPTPGEVYHVWADTSCKYRVQVYGR